MYFNTEYLYAQYIKRYATELINQNKNKKKMGTSFTELLELERRIL